MIRKTLQRVSMLAYTILILGRLFHIKFILDRIYDLYIIYQTAWKTSKPVCILFQDRQDLWRQDLWRQLNQKIYLYTNQIYISHR